MYRIVVVYNKSFTFRSMLEKSFPKKKSKEEDDDDEEEEEEEREGCQTS